MDYYFYMKNKKKKAINVKEENNYTRVKGSQH